MERSTQIWIGVVVLAGLAAGVYKVSKDDDKKGSAAAMTADLPDLKVTTEDLDKILITNAAKSDVELDKKGDGKDAKWVLVKPVEAPANQTNVKQLLDNMKELKTKESIISNATDDQKKEYEFDKDKAVHVVAYKGADKKLDVTFGKSGARGQMAMVDGKTGIYSVGGYSSYAFAREVKGWRDTEIFKFDDANADHVTIDNKTGSFSFTKGDNWAGTLNGKPIPELDPEKVKDGVRNLKALNAEDFGDGKSDTGLDSPEGKITISLKDGAGTYALKVGKVSAGTSHFAQKDGDPTIFVVPQHATDLALTDVAKLQKPKDAGADAAKPASSGPTKMELPPGLTMPKMPGGHP